jgi:ABC-type transport system involved in multi-copper enzyme maturation permease subunit
VGPVVDAFERGVESGAELLVERICSGVVWDDSIGRVGLAVAGAAIEPMSFLPIVKRELTVAARRPLTYYGRAASGAAAGFIGLGFLMISLSSGRVPAELGRDLFFAVSGLAFFCASLAGVALTADSISSERRAGTLELIFLSGLRSYDLVLGKLAAALLPSLYALLAILPITAWAFFLGGISPETFGRMGLVLGHTLFFSLAAGLFVTALCRDGRKAILLAILLIGMVVGMFPMADFSGNAAGKVERSLGWLRWGSPGYAFLLVSDAGMTGRQAEIWQVLLGIGLFSAGLLAGASVAVSWGGLSGPAVRTKRIQRKKKGERLWLETNPMVWLESRQPARWWAVLILFGLVLVVLKLAWSRPGGALLRWELILFPLFFVHVGMKLWVGWEGGRRFAEDRQNGALELLLSSPLDEWKILRGWLIGMKRRFVGPVAALLFLDFGLFWIAAPRWLPDPIWGLVCLAAGFLFLVDLYALTWVGIWQGLVARSAFWAFLRTVGLILFLPALIFLSGLGLIGLFSSGFSDSIGPGELALMWFLFSATFSMGFCGWSIHRLADDFREMASLAGRR